MNTVPQFITIFVVINDGQIECISAHRTDEGAEAAKKLYVLEATGRPESEFEDAVDELRDTEDLYVEFVEIEDF